MPGQDLKAQGGVKDGTVFDFESSSYSHTKMQPCSLFIGSTHFTWIVVIRRFYACIVLAHHGRACLLNQLKSTVFFLHGTKYHSTT